MRRRELIGLIGGAAGFAAAHIRRANAQDHVRRVGALEHALSRETDRRLLGHVRTHWTKTPTAGYIQHGPKG